MSLLKPKSNHYHQSCWSLFFPVSMLIFTLCAGTLVQNTGWAWGTFWVTQEGWSEPDKKDVHNQSGTLTSMSLLAYGHSYAATAYMAKSWSPPAMLSLSLAHSLVLIFMSCKLALYCRWVWGAHSSTCTVGLRHVATPQHTPGNDNIGPQTHCHFCPFQ